MPKWMQQGGFFHMGEQNECQCELLRCDHPAAQTGGIGTLHEKRSKQNCSSDRKTDRGRCNSFDIKISNLD